MSIRTRRWPLAWAAFAAVALPAVAHAQLRVVNWNIAHMQGDPVAMQAVFSAIATDNKPGFAVAPHIIVCEEVRSADINALEAMIDASVPGLNYTRATYTTSGSEDGAGGAIALFYRPDTVLEIPGGHKDLATGGSRNTDRWQLQLVGYTSAAAKFYLYGSHLKASSGSANEAERLAGATTIRNDADTLPAGTHIIYCGDFNLYSNTEPAYLEFLSAGNGQAFDPLGTGSWSGAGNAIKHTQSPLDVAANGLVGGGMDDRFDFQISTAAFQDGNGLSLIANTYRPFCNDGAHYNLAINAGNNTYYPANIGLSNAIADNLYVASDHLPVIAEYQIPAMMSASMAPTFGKVIQNTPFTVNAFLQNIAAGLPVGIDALDYSIQGSGSLSGSSSGTAPLAPSVAVVPVTVVTSNVGAVGGTALVTATSEGAQPSPILLSTSGQVVRKSNGSFNASSDVNATTVALSAAVDSPPIAIPVAIYNFGWDANQALLDVDGVAGLGGGYSLTGGLQSGLGGTPATLQFSFDAPSFGAGTYSKTVTIQTSDENIPGASAALLSLTLEVTLTPAANPADFNHDEHVDGADLAVLLGQWGTAGSADLDGSGTVDGADLAIFLGAWG